MSSERHEYPNIAWTLRLLDHGIGLARMLVQVALWLLAAIIGVATIAAAMT